MGAETLLWCLFGNVERFYARANIWGVHRRKEKSTLHLLKWFSRIWISQNFSHDEKAELVAQALVSALSEFVQVLSGFLLLEQNNTKHFQPKSDKANSRTQRPHRRAHSRAWPNQSQLISLPSVSFTNQHLLLEIQKFPGNKTYAVKKKRSAMTAACQSA